MRKSDKTTFALRKGRVNCLVREMILLAMLGVIYMTTGDQQTPAMVRESGTVLTTCQFYQNDAISLVKLIAE